MPIIIWERILSRETVGENRILQGGSDMIIQHNLAAMNANRMYLDNSRK